MRRSSRSTASSLLILPLLLGCAAPATAAPAQDQESAPAPFEIERHFEPIRFGDPTEVAYDRPFFPETSYDDALPTPTAIIGDLHGSRLIHHAEINECFRRWAAASDRVRLMPYARSHEGRDLVLAVVSSPANLERLDEILEGLGRLADPRGVPQSETDRIASESPAVAWLGYSIHGDELSGADASVAVGYHLIAGTSEDVTDLLDDLVVVIDPCMNPDGRERIVAMVEQSFGLVPNFDHTSMQRGRWPWGRGNHYLFDMNRDWMAGVQPETRGRWRAALSFHPQLFVDAHEMGPLDTFLFYPQADPHNPNLPERLKHWQKVFGDEQGAAFDAQGWAYYTREWADAWGPFYSDAWGSLNGAIGILYEQARTAGVAHERESGRVLTYRESVHHQAVSSLANLTSLAQHRREVLADYAAGRRANVSEDVARNDRMFVLVSGRNADREAALLGILQGQGIEVRRAFSFFEATNVEDTLGARSDTREIPPGSYLVHARQPQSPILHSFLSFDIRMDEESILREREKLEREGSSTIYDATAWSLPLAFGVEAYWCDAKDVAGELVEETPAIVGRVVPVSEGQPVAWAVDGANDGALRFAVRAMELGVAVHVGGEEFSAAGRMFPRGSLLVRANENGPNVAKLVAQAAAEARVEVTAATSGRSPDEGPDLGGQHFALLARPRVALLGNSPVSPDSYGHLWHWLDREVGVSVSMLDAQSFGSYDLRRYNVIVLPPAYGGLDDLLSANAEALQRWVGGGGTLIACGAAAASVANDTLGLTSVVRRRNALGDLDGYTFAAKREAEAREIDIDWDELWDGQQPAADSDSPPATSEGGLADPDDARQDEWQRRFAPRGVFLRAWVDEEHWIAAGCGPQMPVYVDGSSAYLSRFPAQTAVRLSGADDLRVSGLLWPEARARLADTAFCTVERLGQGQVILFASTPAYRGYVRSTARLLGNAVVYGPGLGANPPIGR